jgi:putative endonuclease
MTTDRQRTGNLGEQIAARHLADAGYDVLERNHRTPHGEIDIVCDHNSTLVFVEVRTRRPGPFGSPEQSITPRKATNMTAAAEHYLQLADAKNRDWRIDLVAVEMGHDGKLLRVEVLENAVEA